MTDKILIFPLRTDALVAVHDTEGDGYLVEIWDWPALADAGRSFQVVREAVCYALDLSDVHGLPYCILCDFDGDAEVSHG